MKHELFTEQPSMELKRGIRVGKDTTLTYKNDKVDQVLGELILHTKLSDEGTDGVHAYKSNSNITIKLIEGDILLFDEDRGYYMPKYPMTTIEEAINDISSLEGITLEG